MISNYFHYSIDVISSLFLELLKATFQTVQIIVELDWGKFVPLSGMF